MLITRLHLFEFHDLPWFPAVFRNALTEWLRIMWEHTGAYARLAPVLAEVLRKSGAATIIDLCSGAGGPLTGIQTEMEATGLQVRAVVTDKFPNIERMEQLKAGGMVDARLTSVDATAVPRDLPGLRTLFNSFHHFRPGQAHQILQDAFNARQPIGIFEIPNRSVSSILFSFVATFIGVLAYTPSMRPRRLAWCAFTYLVPVIPFIVAWDGWVSHLRAYTPEELLRMTGDLTDLYRWEVRRIELRDGRFTVTVLLGIPEPSGHLSRQIRA